MKKILPFIEPVNACYPTTSEASAILFADPMLHDWMMNNFIQVYEVDGSHVIDYYDFSINNNPFLSYNEIDFSFIKRNWKNFIIFLKDAIDDDYYIRVFVNMSKLPLYCNEKDIQHDLIVFGYDEEKELLYVADHFHNGRFSQELCTYSEFSTAFDLYQSDSFENLPAFLSSVQMIKKECDFMRLRYGMYTSEEMDYILTLNTNRIYNSLIDYIEARPVIGWFSRGCVMDDGLSKSHRWGIDCYDILSLFAQELLGNIEYSIFAKQSYYLMYNSKVIMIERIKTLHEKAGLDNYQVHSNNFENLRNMMKRVMMLYLNYLVKADKAVTNGWKKYDSLTNLLDRIKEADMRYIELLLKDIEKIRRYI